MNITPLTYWELLVNIRNPSWYTQRRLEIQGSVTSGHTRIALLAVQCRVLLSFTNSPSSLGECFCLYRTTGVCDPNATAPSLLPHHYTRVRACMPIPSSGCSGVQGSQPILASLSTARELGGLDDLAVTLTASHYQTQELLYQALSHFQQLGEYYPQCLLVAYTYCPDSEPTFSTSTYVAKSFSLVDTRSYDLLSCCLYCFLKGTFERDPYTIYLIQAIIIILLTSVIS